MFNNSTLQPFNRFFFFSFFIFCFLLFTFYSPVMPAETIDLTSEGELQAPPAVSSDAGPLISAIEKRKADLDKRADELEQENKRLEALKTEMNALLEKYTQEKEAARQVKSADNIDEKQLEHLSKVYEAMPAKDAALRIERLKEPLALKLLSSIKPKIAAKILNEIKPSRAAHLTEKLAKTTP